MDRRAEWDAHIEKSRHNAEAGRIHVLASAARAEVPAARLVQTDEWNFFQQYVQGAIEAAQGELDTAMPRLLSNEPGSLTHDSLLDLKVQSLVLSERIRTLEMMLSLPGQIQEDAHAAREWLERDEWLKNQNSN